MAGVKCQLNVMRLGDNLTEAANKKTAGVSRRSLYL
jgi:hypothetical protein